MHLIILLAKVPHRLMRQVPKLLVEGEIVKPERQREKCQPRIEKRIRIQQ